VLAQAALRLLEADARVARIHLVVTDTGARLLAHELGIATSDAARLPPRGACQRTPCPGARL